MAVTEVKSADQRGLLPAIAVWIRWQAYLGKHYLLHTFNDIKKNKVNYSLGFFACFLVVFVVSLVVTIIGNTPIVFLKLAELEAGELDMVIYSDSWTENELNYTQVAQILSDEKAFSYHTPRHVINSAAIIPASKCPQGLDPWDPKWKYSGSCLYCFNTECGYPDTVSPVYVIDTEKEARMVLGRDWKLPPAKEGYAYMHKSLARDLGVVPGDIVYLQFNIMSTMEALWYNALDSTNDTVHPSVIYSGSYIYAPFILSATFTNANGKFGSDQDTATVVEYGPFLQYLVKTMDPELGTGILSYLNNSDLYDYAESINFNLQPERVPNYINTDQGVVTENVVQWASSILYRIGFNVVNADLVVLTQLSASNVVSLFLGLILNIIIFILLFLSIILIYSLLMINVETKTFEMGVMRMIGITRAGLVNLLLYQAFSYSIPSWVVGLILSQIFGVFVAKWFKGITGVPIDPHLTPNAILLASALGLLIPIVSSIFPIRHALGKNLHDSLDTHRSKTQAVQVTIDRAEDNTFSVPVLIIGFALASFGFGIYYVFPLALLAMNFALLLNMFFFLLIGMLFGMVLLSLNVGQMLEKAVVWGFFFWENRSIPQVVLKNLVAHRIRNRKTTIMYALSLGFIIFINVTYQMQESSITYQSLRQHGALIRVNFPRGSTYQSTDFKAQLEYIGSTNPKVESFAWVSKPLRIADPYISNTEISNIGHLYRDISEVYAVSPNFFETTVPDFLTINEVFHDPDINLASEDQLAQQLYSAEGSKSMIIGTRYKTFMGLSGSHPHFLMDKTYKDTVVHTRLKPMAFLDSAPLYTFSKFPSVRSQSSLVSFSTYVRLSNGSVPSVEYIPMHAFMIKMVSGATDKDKDDLIQTLKDTSARQPDVRVFDYRTVSDPLETASVVLQYFFDFTTVIAMLISFFSLMSSMYTNVHEQVKEIGILRAMGISKFAMYRVYMYEAFVLVFASSLLGILIGTAVAYTVLLQRILFTQLPIPFVLPTQLLIVVFVSSVIFAAMAAFGPIKSVLSKPIVNSLRG